MGSGTVAELLPITKVMPGTFSIGMYLGISVALAPSKEIKKRNGHRNRKKKKKGKGEERELPGLTDKKACKENKRRHKEIIRREEKEEIMEIKNPCLHDQLMIGVLKDLLRPFIGGKFHIE